MAKAPKYSTTPDCEPLQSTQDDWMLLNPDAFMRAKKAVGGWQLAAMEIGQRLVSGDLTAQDRLVTCGEGIQIIPLRSEDWKGRKAHADAHDLWFSGFFPLLGHNIFVRRAQVYRIFPIAGEWIPLNPDAFTHVHQIVGGWQLAAEDIRQRLESGDVEAEDRVITSGERIEIKPLTPEDVKGRIADADGHGLSFSGFSPLQGHNIFLRRADVYRIWPMRLAEPASPPEEQATRQSRQLPTTRPKGLGPKAWLAAREVYKFRQEGGKWINIEHDLLSKIQNRLGGAQWLGSPTTLKTAVAWLRREGLIDL